MGKCDEEGGMRGRGGGVECCRSVYPFSRELLDLDRYTDTDSIYSTLLHRYALQ